MHAQALVNTDVIITRPVAQAQSWQTQLQALGARCLLVPVLEITPLQNPQDLNAIKQTILQFDNFQKVIFISQNALLQALKWLEDYWPQLPMGIDYFAIGSSTAALARQHGLAVQQGDQAMNSEALLALPGLQPVAGEKILIFRGQGGRAALQQTLIARGAAVTHCELYSRSIPATAAAQIAQLNRGSLANPVLSAHSGESLEHLHRLLVAQQHLSWLSVPILLPGERVASLAQQLGFNNCIVALNATDAAMTEALLAWRHSQTLM